MRYVVRDTDTGQIICATNDALVLQRYPSPRYKIERG